MPGNVTVYKDRRAFMPAFWQEDTINKSLTDQPITIAGLKFDTIPMLGNVSVVGVIISLSTAIITGTITLEITKDGVGTGETKALDSGSGTNAVWVLPPGTLSFSIGDRIGLNATTSGDLDPDNTIDVLAYIEVQLI